MKNLVILNRGVLPVKSETATGLPLTHSTFDPLNNSITTLLGPDSEYGQLEIQKVSRTGKTDILASFQINATEEQLQSGVKVLSFAHFEDELRCVVVLNTGDIYTVTYQDDQEEGSEIDPYNTLIECVGSIDSGLSAAKWSHDEETLVLVTLENSMILLSRQFDSIGELKFSVSDAELSNHVDVGWGSKETQFRGKGARQAERDLIKGLDLERDLNKRDPTMPLYVDDGRLSELDTNDEVTVAWRKDCEFFCVSSVEVINEIKRRIVRVFDRSGNLVNVSEPVDFQEWQLDWGTLITSVKRSVVVDELDQSENEQLEVIFFEKNGLRHGQFTVPPTVKQINTLKWNSTNEVLAVQTSDHSIQLWTTNNYHWYLKQQIDIPVSVISSYNWHPEKPLTLSLTTSTSQIHIVDLSYKTHAGSSNSQTGSDIGLNMVIDGPIVGLTPLSLANVPPPVSFKELMISGEIATAVRDVGCDLAGEQFIVLTDVGVELHSWDLKKIKKGGDVKFVKGFEAERLFGDELMTRQVVFGSDSNTVVVLADDFSRGVSQLIVIDISTGELIDVIDAPLKVILLRNCSDWSVVCVECIDGSVYALEGQELKLIAKFGSLCCDFEVARLDSGNSTDEQEQDDEYELPNDTWNDINTTVAAAKGSYTAFGLTNTGKLYQDSTQLSSSITSLKLTESHLLLTTAQHHLRFIHLTADIKPFVTESSSEGLSISDERVREIERGAVLVNVIPSKATVILQAQRGNLETIQPRILILNKVRSDIKAHDYHSAFISCRTHRIDLDILYDYDPALFEADVESFVKQIGKVSYLDLFVSCLHEEDVTKTKYVETKTDEEAAELILKQQAEKQNQQNQNPNFKPSTWIDPKDSKINKICQLVLDVLLSTEQYREKYLQTILTAYACMKPANLQSALELISSLKDVSVKEKAVVHLCFLQDVNLLYKVALGLYDIKLTLAIAQQSQKDPKEYLPFLQNLFDQTELRRRFLIDDHLGNHEKALGHLVEIIGSEEINEELKDYVVKHSLYQPALSAYKKSNEQQDVILKLYAKYLHAKQDYSEAGLTYELLQDYSNALDSYVSGQRWREALSILSKVPTESLEDITETLITALNENHKYSAVARIQHQLLNDVPSALASYCKEYQYEEALLLASSSAASSLDKSELDDIITSGISTGFATIAELLADCSTQLSSQLRRLRELRVKKTSDPFAFHTGAEDSSNMADDVSIAPSETSTKESFFTRYTGKTSGTAATGVSRRTIKNKKREERKKARGKKGTIYEEEYLIRSVGRLIERLEQTKPEALRLIEALIRGNRREQAREIQSKFKSLVAELEGCVGEVFDVKEEDRERVDEYGEWYCLPVIEKPAIPTFEALKVLDY
ncbi:hypothetical protein WICPIJ_005119 [Wickerhamomyces pijperi]|uniref:Elongator complex protein 1 n=1 Tax=Wickerhamomyces pijperi TaxID=599730 RepID=A0A9P8Q6R6_WICPI|nr:hypothetical protein WICPIJ_005119 [Wickerhamomyces pijperi]